MNKAVGWEGAYMRTFWSSPHEANIRGFVGFQETQLMTPGWASNFSSSELFSLCQMYMCESVRTLGLKFRLVRVRGKCKSALTFAAADDEVFVRTSKATLDNVVALPLAGEPTNGLESANIQYLDFIIGPVDENVCGVLCELDASDILRLNLFALELFLGGEVVEMNDIRFRDRDHQTRVWGDSYILHATIVLLFPLVAEISFQIPEAYW